MSATERMAAVMTATYRVRFDECGPDGLARTSALLRYAQDVAWIHSERAGFDRAWYAQRGLAWVVRAAELVLLAPVALGTTLTLSTEVTGIRRVWARRRTEARLADGSLAMWSHTDWVMTDSRGMPGRIPPEFGGRFGTVPGSFEPGRVPLPPTPADAATLRSVVRPQDIDPMAHVNNAAYVDYLEDALLAAGEAGATAAADAVAAMPRTLRIEYLVAAAPRAEVAGTVWPTDVDGRAGWAWRLVDADDADLAHGLVLPGT